MRSPASNPGYVQRHAWKPDIDKLLRSTLDALTLAMVWGDDKQAAELQVAKLYCAHDRSPGPDITITGLDNTPASQPADQVRPHQEALLP
jgi:Holliday junction resolvase RusA-like endonuclease